MSVLGPPIGSLYVGDLDPTVSESDLLKTFSAVGPVASVRLCLDSTSGASLGYGYVNFFSWSDASNALESLNHTQLKGKQMRIMWLNRDPILRKNGVANLFVKNLDPSIDSAGLHKIFENFGRILSCKVADANGNSKGFGYVQFDSEEAAQSAINALHGSIINGKKAYVSNFVKKTEKLSASEEPKFTNVYVKNLESRLTDDLLREKFSVFGNIISALVMKDEHGNSRGFGFVSFKLPEEAKKAVEAMNGAQLGSKKLYVGRAQKKAEREKILSSQFKGLNVYVKNLDGAVDDNILQECFSVCGEIISVKVMCDDEGLSRGFGFVCFSTPNDADKAVAKFHGTTFYGKILYVAIAQRKEDRQAELKLQYSKRTAAFPRSTTLAPSSCHSSHFVPASMSTVSQNNPYQPITYQDFGMSGNTLCPATKPIYPPMCSSKQSQANDWVNELPLLETQHAMLYPYYQPPLLHPVNADQGMEGKQFSSKQSQVNDWVNEPLLLETPQCTMLYPYFQPPLHPVNAHQGVERKQPLKYASGKQYQQRRCGPSEYPKRCCYKNVEKKTTSSSGPSYQGLGTLRKMLEETAPRQHKRIIRNYLYPLVQEHQYKLAEKITEMLLEMNTTELLALVESRNKLAAQVKLAVEVLKSAKSKTVAPQDGSDGGGMANLENYCPVEVAVN